MSPIVLPARDYDCDCRAAAPAPCRSSALVSEWRSDKIEPDHLSEQAEQPKPCRQ
jgi:hypothetical protein